HFCLPSLTLPHLHGPPPGSTPIPYTTLFRSTQRRRRTRSEALTAALTGMNRTRTAHALPAPIEFDRCPRCLQALAEHRAEPGTRLLCLQDTSEEEPDRSRRGSRSCDDDQGQLPFSIHGEDPAQKHQLDHQRENIRLLLEQGKQEKE